MQDNKTTCTAHFVPPCITHTYTRTHTHKQLLAGYTICSVTELKKLQDLTDL